MHLSHSKCVGDVMCGSSLLYHIYVKVKRRVYLGHVWVKEEGIVWVILWVMCGSCVHIDPGTIFYGALPRQALQISTSSRPLGGPWYICSLGALTLGPFSRVTVYFFLLSAQMCRVGEERCCVRHKLDSECGETPHPLFPCGGLSPLRGAGGAALGLFLSPLRGGPTAALFAIPVC